ncbi:MAK10-like protein [Tanacetum coccineum]
MGDENPIRTLGDYSKPSHEGYRNTIELPEGNNVDFLKLVDSLDLNVENGERTRLRLFQFSLRDQASNWLKRLPAGSISTWEDLTTRFLAQFFPPGRTAKLQNDILMFQQHQGESLSEAWTRFKDLLQNVPRHAGGKLHDRNTEESWALLEYLALYDNESWNDPRDFAKPVKAISLPQDVPSTSDRRLIELDNQVQRLMEAHLAPKQPIQVNKISSSCEICSSPHDTQHYMKNPEQAFVDYASSRTDEAGGKWFTIKPEKNHLGDTYNPSWKSHPNLRWRQPQNSQNNFPNPPNRFQSNGSFQNRPFNTQSNLEGMVSNFMASQDARLSKFEADFKQQQSEMTSKIDTVLKAITDRITGTLPSDTVKNPKLNVSSKASILSARSYQMEDPQCSSQVKNSINAITTCSEQPNESGTSNDDTFTISEIGTSKPKEPKCNLKDEFQDLHLNLPVLEVLAHAPIYNALLDKYVESLELGENGSAFIQGELPKRMEDPGLFTLPCRLGDSEPYDTLADLGSCINIIPLYLFKMLNIGLLEETDHVFRLADGTKSYPIGIVKDVEVHIGRLKLLNDFYVIDMKKDPKTPLLVGRGFLATANAVIDCKKAKIAVGEGITRSVFEVKENKPGEEEEPYWTTLGKRESYKTRPNSEGIGAQIPYYARKEFLDCHLPGEWEMARDAEINPFKDILVFRRMVEFLGAFPINLKGNMWESEDLILKPINWSRPPKDGDGAWHAKIRIIDPDREEFTKTFQSIPTFRKLSEKESPRDIIDLDYFHDT